MRAWGLILALVGYSMPVAANAVVLTEVLQNSVGENDGWIDPFDAQLGELRAVTVEFDLGEAVQGPRGFLEAGPASFDIVFDGAVNLAAGSYSQGATLHTVRHFEFEALDGSDDFAVDM